MEVFQQLFEDYADNAEIIPSAFYEKIIAGLVYWDELDLKKRGVLPITELTRLHALAAKLPQVNTAERLQALSNAKKMSLVDSRNIQDALHCIQQQRLNHQCELILAGEPSSNYINPKDLPKLAKEQLRDAFTIIDEAQTSLRLQFRGGLN